MKKEIINPIVQQFRERMESLKDANTIVEVLHQAYKDGYLDENRFLLGRLFEKLEHQDTWDAAIQSYIESENNIVIATRDFDAYWENKSELKKANEK
jgi:hypothetical protein